MIRLEKIAHVSLYAFALTLTFIPTSHAIDLPLTIAPDQTSGYERTLFKHWIDADKDKCDTRKEVLIQESVSTPKLGANCAITGGKWISSYDGRVTSDATTLDIDHLVPLSEAWKSGAYKWNTSQREAFANDLSDERVLVAVTASLNRSKGDQDPANWMPPKNQCSYISQWISVKIRYSLTVDSDEAKALTSWISTCSITSFTATALSGYSAFASNAPIINSSPVPSGSPTTSSLPTASATNPTPGATRSPSAAATTSTKKKPKLIKYSNCSKARAAGVTPIKKSTNKTLYYLNRSLDRDGDGVACE
ncbi:unannotated protein [freshwater metagenome]|uniref:Unannotated protein n=1 Tax=freshwater metagenome TaxID=449393 RepID=A0A6J7XST9_9ZZZZ|nr:DUF1524 domain-containing protein [Actinomycetota bacterium]